MNLFNHKLIIFYSASLGILLATLVTYFDLKISKPKKTDNAYLMLKKFKLAKIIKYTINVAFLLLIFIFLKNLLYPLFFIVYAISLIASGLFFKLKVD